MSQQCKGTTKQGKQCTKITKDPSGYCYLHKPTIRPTSPSLIKITEDENQINKTERNRLQGIAVDKAMRETARIREKLEERNREERNREEKNREERNREERVVKDIKKDIERIRQTTREREPQTLQERLKLTNEVIEELKLYKDKPEDHDFPETIEQVDYLINELGWRPTVEALFIELDKDLEIDQHFSSYRIFEVILSLINEDIREVENLLFPKISHYLRIAAGNRDEYFIRFMYKYIQNKRWLSEEQTDLETIEYINELYNNLQD